jgi:hypothetical protein
MDVLDDEREVPVVGEVGRGHEVWMWLRIQQAHTVELSLFGWTQEQLGSVLCEFTVLPLSEKTRHD